jgi:hypothetical protein
MVIIAPRQYNITTWHYIIFFSHASILFYFILLLFNDYISRRAPLDAKILFHHTLADGVIKVLVLSKSVQGEVPINLVQRSEQGSNELHATDPAKQIGCGLVACGVIGLVSQHSGCRGDCRPCPEAGRARWSEHHAAAAFLGKQSSDWKRMIQHPWR